MIVPLAAAVAATETALRDRGVLAASALPLPQLEPGRPWFVSALLGFSGWLAACFTFGFVAAVVRPDHAPGFAFAGVVLLGAAYALFRSGDGPFRDQFALASSLAGHTALLVAFSWGFDAWGHTTAVATAFAAAALQAAWALAAPNRLARVISTLFACAAAAFGVRLLLAGEHHMWEPREAVALLPALLGWAAVWAPAALAASGLVAAEPRWMALPVRRAARPVLTGLLLALALVTPASDPLEALDLWRDAPARTSWLALWPLLAIGAALLVLWLAHRVRSRALQGAAIAGALLHVFHFYLLVGTTLLVKAAIMSVSGALLLGAAFALERRRAAP